MTSPSRGRRCYVNFVAPLLIALVLGGIWLGFFTPTEGAGVGATFALILALLRGMKMYEMLAAILSVGRTASPLLLLLRWWKRCSLLSRWSTRSRRA